MKKNYLSFHKKKWFLDNAEKIYEEAKYTFFIPRKQDIANLKKGDIVKLIFREKRYGAERMWVIVNNKRKIVKENGEIEYRFSGILNNQPFQLRAIICDDVVVFNGFNICSIYGVDNDRVHPDLEILGDDINIIQKKTWINKSIIDGDDKDTGKGIEYIYKEEPLSDDDSGWRMLTGDENIEFLKDTNNFQYVLFGRILNGNDSMLNLLTCQIGKHFKFNLNKQLWEEVKDESKFLKIKIESNN